MLEVLKQGGVTVIPLAICSILSVAISLERLFYLRKTKTSNFKLLEKVKLNLNKGRIEEIRKLIDEADGPVAGILSEGIRYYGYARNEIKDNLEIIGRSEIKKLEKRIGALDVIAGIAPLLGLLGTVLGIMKSFNILSAAQGMASPVELSFGISQALISTAIGLVVAIPTMLMYSYLLSLVEDRIEEINYWFVDLVEILSQGGKNV